jgi:predicted acetyltransferase
MSQLPFLSPPDVAYKDSYIEAAREYQRVDGRNPRWHYEKLENNFDEFVEMRRSYETDPPAGRVPQTEYWLIVNGSYAGEIRIRHHLVDELKRFGGHIGYEVRPSMRRRGYGTLQLKLALQKVKHNLGLERVLITCDDDNIGSQRIIEHNGGRLIDKVDNDRDSLTRRYRIDLRDTPDDE